MTGSEPVCPGIFLYLIYGKTPGEIAPVNSYRVQVNKNLDKKWIYNYSSFHSKGKEKGRINE